MLYKPINNWINVCGILAWDHVATNFSVSNWLESPAEHNAIFSIRITKQKERDGTLYHLNIHQNWLINIAWESSHHKVKTCLTFDQSKPVKTELLACQPCSLALAVGYHSVKICSANHAARFLRYSHCRDLPHQQHNCRKEQVIKT